MSINFKNTVLPQAKVQNFTTNENKLEDKSKSTSNIKKAVLVATGIGISALCAYGIYAATKGKVKPTSVKPNIDSVTNNSTNIVNTVQEKLSKIVDDFKALPYERNQKLKDAKPTITQLRNGKYKVDIKSDNKQNIFVCDKLGNFEKMIQMDYYGNKRIATYTFDGINTYAHDTHCIRAVTGFSPTMTLDNGIKYKRIEYEKDGCAGHILTKKYGDVMFVKNEAGAYTPESYHLCGTFARLSEGKPNLVYQAKTEGNKRLDDVAFIPSAKPNKTVDKDASTMREILKDMDEKFVQIFIGIEPR